MNQFCTGEEVHHEGGLYRPCDPMGLRLSTAAPPLWIAATQPMGRPAGGAARDRASRAAPLVSHQDVQALVQTFRHTWQQGYNELPTRVGAWSPI